MTAYHGGSGGARIGKAKANAATWKHPAGHASWCASAVPFIRRASAGDTAMAKAQCSCPRNTLARALRNIAARREAVSAPGGVAAGQAA